MQAETVKVADGFRDAHERNEYNISNTVLFQEALILPTSRKSYITMVVNQADLFFH